MFRRIAGAVARALVSKELRPAEILILRAVIVAVAAAAGIDIAHLF